MKRLTGLNALARLNALTALISPAGVKCPAAGTAGVEGRIAGRRPDGRKFDG
jgi:hypothetical protein